MRYIVDLKDELVNGQMEIFLVGGAVRDELLGLAIREKDWVVVGATPDEMRQLRYKEVGKDFPVFLHPETNEEYALARTERKTGQGHKAFSFHTGDDVSLEDDLMRRDLTVNAIAKANDGTLIDPYNGQQDLANKILRHVSDAFKEDPLRVFRLARFYARFSHLGFQVATTTLELVTSMRDELSSLSAERIWKETSRALISQNPENYFQLLRDTNTLESWMPELSALDQDHWEKSIAATQRATDTSRQTSIRFAALLCTLNEENIEALCRRIKTDKHHLSIALMASRIAPILKKAGYTSEVVIELLERCDAFRRPDPFEQALTAATYAVVEDIDIAQSRVGHWLARRDAANKIDHASIANQCEDKSTIGDAIRNARLSALMEYERSHDE